MMTPRSVGDPNQVIDAWFAADFADQPDRVLSVYLVSVAQVLWQGIDGLLAPRSLWAVRRAARRVRRCFSGIDPLSVTEGACVLKQLAEVLGRDFLGRTLGVRERAEVGTRFALTYDDGELDRALAICPAAQRHLVVGSDADGLIVEEQRIRFPARSD
jgi:hypothetical protein